VDARQIDADVAGCAAAHQRLLAALTELTDEQARRDSLLPGWTVGHVLTHLARNADGIVRMVEGACRGEMAEQYPGGRATRDSEIEDGALRPARELVADVRTTIDAVEAAFASCTAQGWAGHGRGLVLGEIPVAQMPRRRWREVEVHHADLGLTDLAGGFGPVDWSPAFVRSEVAVQTRTWQSRRPMGLTDLPPAVLALEPHDRLAWLLGRTSIPGIDDAGLMA
jgi:maleylpyruvate isomerase